MPFLIADLILDWIWVGVTVFALLGIISDKIRKSAFTPVLRRVLVTMCLLIGPVWLLSITICVRVPYSDRAAIGIGNGVVLHTRAYGNRRKELSFGIGWEWSGITAGRTTWNRSYWTGRDYEIWEGRAVWPLLLGLAIPTTILLFIKPRQFPSGHCSKCGYDLTGNVSGVCPECGRPIGSSPPRA